MSTEQVVDAKKTKIDETAAWQLLKDAGSIAIAKGKKIHNFSSTKAAKEEILKHAMGPSGNLRAPTYRVGDDYVVGFNEELYQQWID